ncbi:hypothetical protein [Methanobacterium sp.]
MRIHIYNTKEECLNAAVVNQETEKRHSEKFYREKSALIYYILEGENG